MISQERLNLIVKEYRSKLVLTLGDELHSIVLYGSQARKEAVEGSDIDVLCVMNNPFKYGELINRTSKSTAEVSLKYDVVISRVFVGRQEALRVALSTWPSPVSLWPEVGLLGWRKALCHTNAVPPGPSRPSVRRVRLALGEALSSRQ